MLEGSGNREEIGGIMYSIGDRVVYGIHGICLISQIEDRIVDKKRVSYYVLSPLDRTGTLYYIPVNNTVALSKIRPIMTVQQLTQVLESPEIFQECWIEEENRRKLYYKELSSGCDFLAIAKMVHTLLQHRKRQAAAGRKFHLCDENFLRDGQKMLESEISVVMDVPIEEAKSYLQHLT